VDGVSGGRRHQGHGEHAPVTASTSAIQFRPWQPLPAEAELRAGVREFLAGEQLSPACDSWLSGFDAEFSRRLGRAGYVGISIPARYGGHGRSALERYIVIEELLAAGAPVGAHWIADRQTAPLLLRYGTEQQRQQFLPAIARGECFFSIGLSEPEAGSDLSALRTVARPVPGGYRITGQKLWTTNAHRSHFLVALARTTARSGNPRDGLSQLVVDLSSDDVEVRPIELLNGTAHFNEVFLNDVFVADDMVIGQVNAGWDQVMAELAYERSGPERLLSTFPLLVQLMRQLDTPGHPAAAAVGRMIARISALRSLSRSIAVGLDAGEDMSVQAALVKDAGTRQEQDLVELCRTASAWAGPPGEQFRQLLASALLATPGFTLRGGTNEILRGVVARGLGLR
jgi:alkylation response protein AidB-like acyl-CoA dehydrogenase